MMNIETKNNTYTLSNAETKGGYIQYTATDQQGYKLLAICVLTKTISKSYFFDYFRNMFEILSTVSHPFIQKLIDFHLQNDLFYVFVENGDKTAFSAIKSGKGLVEFEAGSIFVPLIDALRVLHDSNIVHLDIRPENLLYIDSGYKLSNFFMAQLVDTDTIITRYGTPNYQAPEVFQDTGSSNPKAADVWAAGLTLLTLLTGKLMFSSKEIDQNAKLEDLKRKITTQKIEIPKIFSPELNDLLELMLQPNPQNRITVTDILNHQWVKKIKVELKRISRIQNLSIGDMARRFSVIKPDKIGIVLDHMMKDVKPKVIEFCESMGCTVIETCSTILHVKSNTVHILFLIRIKDLETNTGVTIEKIYCEDQSFWYKFATNLFDTYKMW